MKKTCTISNEENELVTRTSGPGTEHDDARISAEEFEDIEDEDEDEGNPEGYQDMSEVQMEDFLAEAIETFAEEQGLRDVWSVSFRSAGLLTGDNGIVLRIGENEFQIRILRTD